MNEYYVIETPMYPNAFKVESRRWPGYNNAGTEYFAVKADAQAEADRRNAAPPPPEPAKGRAEATPEPEKPPTGEQSPVKPDLIMYSRAQVEHIRECEECREMFGMDLPKMPY